MLRNLRNVARGTRTKRASAALWLAIVGLVASLYLSGTLNFAESELNDLRFRLIKREATADLVLVAIDAQSVSELNIWPWPRSLHATVIDNLVAAGAERVAVDIDLSSVSRAEDDQRLAQALARAGDAVILPTFVQRQSSGEGMAFVISEPLPEFREHATIASINVMPEEDGLVRRLSTHQAWPDGTRVPTLSAELAHVASDRSDIFFIDFGIDAASVPTLSYVDVVTGRFDPRVVAGRKVIISATAIELGDIVPVPNARAMPGGLLQALAYQSLVQHRALHPVHPAIVMGLTALAIFCFGAWSSRWRWRLSLAVVVAAVLGAILLSGVLYALLPLMLDVTPIIAGLIFAFIAAVVRRVDMQGLQLFLQGIRLRQTEATMRHVVEHSLDGIITFGADRRIATANSAACQVFGYAPEELVGLDLERLMSLTTDSLPQDDAYLPIARGVREANGRRKNGDEFPLDVALSDMTVDDRVTQIAIVRDISERKQQQVALVHAKKKAEEADNMKAAFLAQMSHELRTPLNAIIGFSELISGELLGPVGTAQYKDYAVDILSSGKHLLDVVNDILDLSKLEAGNYELEEREFDVRRIIDAALTLIGYPDRVSQTLHVAADVGLPPLRADERAVKQILVNLLSNAVKFTGQNGAVHVAACCAAGGPFRITVRDTGIGMRPEDIPIALTPFRQVDARLERSYDGTGLGLPIAAAMMRIHQGTLHIESEPGKGTTVTIEFPVERVVPLALDGAQANNTVGARSPASTPQLIADDRRTHGFAASPSH